MSDKPYNEPAYPVDELSQHDGSVCVQHFGLSMRDYFAAKVMQGLCANPGGPFQSNATSGWALTNCNEVDVACISYALADAMLEQRGKQ